MVKDTGLTRVTFTRAVTGSGIYESADDIKEMTELKEQRQEFSLDSVTSEDQYNVNVIFRINNRGLTEGYKLREIGIYASGDDGKEKLYCVAYTTDGMAEDVPADEGTFVYETTVEVETVISSDATVAIKYMFEKEWVAKYVTGITGDVDPEEDGTLQEQIKKKQDAADGKGLSTNDFTDELKEKLDSVSEGATKTVVDEEISDESTNPVQNKAVAARFAAQGAAVLIQEDAPSDTSALWVW
jgi:hypothetical protein